MGNINEYIRLQEIMQSSIASDILGEMERKGITDAYLSEITQMTEEHIANILDGGISTTEDIARIAHALDCWIDIDLIPNSECVGQQTLGFD